MQPMKSGCVVIIVVICLHPASSVYITPAHMVDVGEFMRPMYWRTLSIDAC